MLGAVYVLRALLVLDRVQRQTVRLITDLALTSNLQSLTIVEQMLHYHFPIFIILALSSQLVPAVPLSMTSSSPIQVAYHPSQAFIPGCRTSPL